LISKRKPLKEAKITDKMSETLGEKLRQARESRGVSISEVADQTRISAHYLECIENDDYRTLPGGIFNKGFLKSYAKYVGLDENEALQDYARLLSSQDSTVGDEPKTYRPEVLTDDRNSSSNLQTIVFAVIILGLLIAGTLAVVNYLQPAQPEVPVANVNSNVNTDPNLAANTNTSEPTTPPAPSLNQAKFTFTALGDDVFLSSTVDNKTSSSLIKSGQSVNFEPKERIRLAYARERVPYAQLEINGRQITLPSAPARGNVSFEINRNNFEQVWQDGSISGAADNTANAPR